jgi:hypothetical protein
LFEAVPTTRDRRASGGGTTMMWFAIDRTSEAAGGKPSKPAEDKAIYGSELFRTSSTVFRKFIFRQFPQSP